MADKLADKSLDKLADKSADKYKESEYSIEEIVHYNINLFLEAIDMIDAANILLSLKNKV
jgi:hypothetical protein